MTTSTAPTTPMIGSVATACFYSDRCVGTITWVSKSGRELIFNECYGGLDKPWCGGTCPGCGNGPEHGHRYTLRQNGRWVGKGESMRGGTRLAIGVNDPYRDPSF